MSSLEFIFIYNYFPIFLTFVNLYDYILKENNIKADEVVMIGDSKVADVKMARAHGLHAIWYFPLKHKLWTNYSRLTKRDFSHHQLRKRFEELYHHSNFAEYSIPIYFFSHKLGEEMKPIVGGKLS